MLAPEARAGRREPSPGHHLPGLPGDKPSLMSAPGLRTHSPPPPRGGLQGPHSLVLNLEVEVPAEPVNEERGLHVAGRCQLPGTGGAPVRRVGMRPPFPLAAAALQPT